MLGHSHALSGACAGTAAGAALHLPVPSVLLLAGLTAGFATMPDLDKCGSGAARVLGPLSEALAWVISKVCRGHRHLTHCAIGIVIFTALAEAACHYRADLAGRIGLVLMLTLAFAASAWALRVAHGWKGELLGLAGAAAMTFTGVGLALVPAACAVGWTTHLIGDSCTDSGVMWLYPLSQHRFHLLPEPLAFTTGTEPETGLVDPLLGVTLAGLAVWAILPAADPAAWDALVRLFAAAGL